MPPLSPPPPSYSSVRCALLTSRLTFTQVEITVGLAGIAAAMALCSSAATCSEFLVNGGLAVIVGEGIGKARGGPTRLPHLNLHVPEPPID